MSSRKRSLMRLTLWLLVRTDSCCRGHCGSSPPVPFYCQRFLKRVFLYEFLLINLSTEHLSLSRFGRHFQAFTFRHRWGELHPIRADSHKLSCQVPLSAKSCFKSSVGRDGQLAQGQPFSTLNSLTGLSLLSPWHRLTDKSHWCRIVLGWLSPY